MDLQKVLQMFSHNLEAKVVGNCVLVVDTYNETDPDYDYGVWAIIENPTNSGMCGYDCIPDFYVNSEIQFYLEEDLEYGYGYSKESVKKIIEAADTYGFYSDEVLDLLKNEKHKSGAFEQVFMEKKALENPIYVPDDYMNKYEVYPITKLYKFRCHDCASLATDDDGKWVCDELCSKCSEIRSCPEFMRF